MRGIDETVNEYYKWYQYKEMTFKMCGLTVDQKLRIKNKMC